MQMHTSSGGAQIVSAEACKILGIDRATLIRWVGTGTVKAATKLPGRTGAFLFNRSDIEKLAAKRAEATA